MLQNVNALIFLGLSSLDSMRLPVPMLGGEHF
jgi:hypothetical protein